MPVHTYIKWPLHRLMLILRTMARVPDSRRLDPRFLTHGLDHDGENLLYRRKNNIYSVNGSTIPRDAPNSLTTTSWSRYLASQWLRLRYASPFVSCKIHSNISSVNREWKQKLTFVCGKLPWPIALVPRMTGLMYKVAAFHVVLFQILTTQAVR